jgi:hypothetical protein
MECLQVMNKNALTETVLLGEKQIERTVDGRRSSNSPVRSTNIVERQLIWSSRKPDDWEILVYKQPDGWEACFFRWPIHHEHATGTSFDLVRQMAERRIRVLEAQRLKSAKWPHRSVAATLQSQPSPASHVRELVRFEPRPTLRTPLVKSLKQPDELKME